ncbi:hypothetical protein A5M85_05100 [Cellulophaga lytica]|uniref:YaaC family protein n=1 Tax=Cellulophaga lytica TaxID=979 RepID=UPI0009508574|nr:YaaC family protein [Cellulophaga lytica]APU09681.1 hypothetical protein A5M85_05100 [Cellulophaga lytica]
MFTYTNTPIKDIWEHLKFVSVENNCKRLLKGEIASSRELIYTNDAVLTKKSREISMCLKQANEYFIASETTSINTSPLLLYYGMLSLSKALIVANNEEIYLDNIKYHGLETRPRYDFLKEYSENESLWQIEKEYAVTNNGVFSHLVNILDEFSFEQSSVIEFKDILKCVPELWGIYEKYYNEKPNILGLYSSKIQTEPDYNLKLYIQGKESNVMLATIPELENDFNIANELYHSQSIEFSSKGLDSFPKYIGIQTPQVGGNYLIKGIRYYNGSDYINHYISPESLDYIAMYILSVCVRYKQVLWGQVISGESSGTISLIQLYINTIKRRFPNRILESLFNERFVYGTTGYF